MTPDDTSVRPPSGKLDKRTRTVDIGGPPAKRIFDQISIVALVLDKEMHVVRLNRAAEEMFGKLHHEVLGRPMAEALPLLARVNREHIIERTLKSSGSANAREVEIPGPEESRPRYFDFTVDTVNGDDGKPAGVSIVGLDCTERTLLRRRLAEQNKELLSLQRVSNALRQTMDLDRALIIISSALTSGETGGYERAMIFLVDDQRQFLTGAVCVDSLGESDPRGIWRGLAANEGPLDKALERTQPVLARRWGELSQAVRGVKIALDDEHDVLAHAIATGETVTHDTLRETGRILGIAQGLHEHFDMRCFAAAPMLADREAMGLIVVDTGKRHSSFSPEQLTMLEMFASQAALAIHNAYKYQNMVERAQRDSLTRLYNHGHFQEVLKAEVERAERYKHQVSLIMIDIDHFKKFNDEYGHQTGDKVLRQTALLLGSLVRMSDVAARYGGEEFAILLPNTPYEAALETAERLRDGIARKATVTGPKSEKLNVTASLGVANFPRNAHSASELVWMSDEAMYLAKNRGRNMVCGADKLPETEDQTVLPQTSRSRRTSDLFKARISIGQHDPVPKRRTAKQPRKSGKVR